MINKHKKETVIVAHKMDDTSPLPPTSKKQSQNILEVNAAILLICSQSLQSSDR